MTVRKFVGGRWQEENLRLHFIPTLPQPTLLWEMVLSIISERMAEKRFLIVFSTEELRELRRCARPFFKDDAESSAEARFLQAVVVDVLWDRLWNPPTIFMLEEDLSGKKSKPRLTLVITNSRSI